MTTELSAPELLQALGAIQPRTGTCQITVVNNCPPNWGMNIIAAGVKFFYHDGTSYTEGSREVNLSSGQSATFIDSDPGGCVSQIFVAILAKAASQPNTQTYTTQDGVPADQCLLHETITLGPKASAARGTTAYGIFALTGGRVGNG